MTVIHDLLSSIRQTKEGFSFSEPQTLSLLLACGASASVKNEVGRLIKCGLVIICLFSMINYRMNVLAVKADIF